MATAQPYINANFCKRFSKLLKVPGCCWPLVPDNAPPGSFWTAFWGRAQSWIMPRNAWHKGSNNVHTDAQLKNKWISSLTILFCQRPHSLKPLRWTQGWKVVFKAGGVRDGTQLLYTDKYIGISRFKDKRQIQNSWAVVLWYHSSWVSSQRIPLAERSGTK